jgi:hypothetical protein
MKQKIKPTPSQIKSASKKLPLDPRENPLARDSRGAAGRTEIRAQTPRISAPRQSNRPVVRSSRNQTHGR